MDEISTRHSCFLRQTLDRSIVHKPQFQSATMTFLLALWRDWIDEFSDEVTRPSTQSMTNPAKTSREKNPAKREDLIWFGLV